MTSVATSILPPSLAVSPNIALRDQTVDQLIAERDYWREKVTSAQGWGASLAAASGFAASCQRELARRETSP